MSGSKLRVQSGGSGSASRSLSHGVSNPPALATDKAADTPDEPSDKAEPETRMSDGLGLSKLKTDHSKIKTT